MNDSFGRAAQRLAGLSARVLGWRPADFWHATPAELSAAITPTDADATSAVGREDISRMMEQDNGDIR
jgi:hypothetical protein